MEFSVSNNATHRRHQEVVHWIFMRALGAIALVAFVSYWIQLAGLIGSHGVAPAEPYLRSVAESLGPFDRLINLPTLAWLSASDTALAILCGTGVLASVLLIANIAPRVMCFFLWALYLSLSNADQVFLSFQWDTLLIETCFLAIFTTPGRGFLMRWLLFRLMFSSGLCKITSQDETWRNLTALYYHYETQPLPTWIGWFAHQLPHWCQKFSVASMFVVELLMPMLIFFPQRRIRHATFGALAGLQLLIFLTGNYCFFNLLTIVLCLFVLDDHDLMLLLPAKAIKWLQKRRSNAKENRLFARGAALVTAVFLVFGSLNVASVIARRGGLPLVAFDMLSAIAPLRTVNSYGLFASMTTERDEITIEGSNDGRLWLPYGFKWKPGPLNERPKFVAPYQPRLDWQMWFAALGNFRSSPWLQNLFVRLLQGEPAVLGLLKTNPFPDKPPRFIRAQIARYQFTDYDERRRTGNWWIREEPQPYAQPLSLRDL